MVASRIESEVLARRMREEAEWQQFKTHLEGFDPQGMRDIELAYRFTQVAFRDKPPRASGDPAFSHSEAVALILLEAGVKDSATIVLGLLHDVDEDTDRLKTLADYEDHRRDSWNILAGAFSNSEIPLGLDFLTEPAREVTGFSKQQTEDVYHARFNLAGERILLVKMADRLHNLRTLRAMPLEKQRKKVEETVMVYFPLFERVVNEYRKEGAYLFNEIKKTITELGYIQLLKDEGYLEPDLDDE